jgi:hypothetical protein
VKAAAAKSSVPDWLAGVPSAVQPIIEAARQTVRTVAPNAEEVACRSQKPRSPSMMWKLARYVVDGEVVVTIGTFTKHASMFFARGRELDDQGGLLEGKGKSLRYTTLRTPADAKRALVKVVLREAFALAERSAGKVEKLEDREDLEAVRKARERRAKGGKTIPFAEVRRKPGI